MTAEPDSSLDALMRRVNARLEALMPPVLAGQPALGEAMRDSVLAPGKRLRPMMTLVVAEDLGGPSDAALDAGCALEMVHAASLILDDLPCMDDAEMRRGRPALHRAHGEDVAVLAAIAILSGAFGTLARVEELAPARRGEAVAVLAEAVGTRGLVAGQFQDLRGGRGQRPLAEIADANGLKTGSLFTAAVELGAVAAEASEAVRADLRAFAAEIGLAFQLLDDLLDGAPSAVSIGKDVGKDQGKSTIVSMIGPTQVRRHIERHVAAAEARLDAVFGPGSRLHAMVAAIFAGSIPEAAADEPVLEHEAAR